MKFRVRIEWEDLKVMLSDSIEKKGFKGLVVKGFVGSNPVDPKDVVFDVELEELPKQPGSGPYR